MASITAWLPVGIGFVSLRAEGLLIKAVDL